MAHFNTKGMGPRLYRGQYPSVTEALDVIYKPHFDRWRNEVGNAEAARVMSDAAAIGTRTHKNITRLANHRQLYRSGMPKYRPQDFPPPHTDLLKHLLIAARDFFDKYIAEVLAVEQELVSEQLRFGGTPDLYARLKDEEGSLAVVDFKATNSLQTSHNWQTALYKVLLEEAGFRVDKRALVQLKKKKPGHFYVRWCRRDEIDTLGGLACVNLWWALNDRKMSKLLAKNEGLGVT